MTMRLKLLLPTRVLIDAAIQRLVAEAENGSFGMLPRHVDFATALRPGILAYQDVENAEHFVGVDEGILVKCRGEVLVSTRNAVIGTDLASLRQTVRERYLELDEGEKLARSALARLEVGVVKRFNELRELR
jgi:F-type H+-transporting ATPase subunit epsilon